MDTVANFKARHAAAIYSLAKSRSSAAAAQIDRYYTASLRRRRWAWGRRAE